ncbi:probable phospholipid-transporting ATPase IA [Schistocerca gregaria]|uniref:probable phospholipid-transporting ATPase IA n=1 Tax=Schistocerca gregaria TaxID=7010 RepID=UPI00211E6270|nr:probable phospholipid-transporting ATPase IA [Schistocerca gregaria]
MRIFRRKPKNRLNIKTIVVNDKTTNNKKPKQCNRVVTAKYTLWTFLPKNLFEQFRHISNVYFLAIGIISSIPSVSPFPLFTAWLPLICVLFFHALKEIVEDVRRQNLDKALNCKIYLVLRDKKITKIKNMHISPGDVIKIRENEEIPADILILYTSNVNNLVYVDTSNLDGESNLKIYRPSEGTMGISKNEIANLDLKVRVGPNTTDFYSFHGILVVGEQQYPIDEQNLLLRGTILRNTYMVYGAVIYTGKKTKIQLNSNKVLSKFSESSRVNNRAVISLLCFKVVLCIGFSVASGIFHHQYVKKADYLNTRDTTSFMAGFNTFWSYFAIFSSFIPISLTITAEFAKIAQALFIGWDTKAASPFGSGIVVKNSNLNDELARVNYIFCDKTGTLTQNRMVFKKAYVKGTLYNESVLSRIYKSLSRSKRTSNRSSSKRAKDLLDFLLLLVLANMTMVSRASKQETSEQKNKKLQFQLPLLKNEICINYQSQSPDELCLCNFAKESGIVLKERSLPLVRIEILGEDYDYQTLQTMEFTSERARMSVIIRTPDDKIILYSKGADHVMMPRLHPNEDKRLIVKTQRQLDKCSSAGLRTLICARKELTKDEYDQIKKRFDEAMCLIDGRKDALEKISDDVERDLRLVGCTAIEDKLQKGVPETIMYFVKSGIKVWIITGDKQTTAINIAKSCNLLHGDIKTIIISIKSENGCKRELDMASETIKNYRRVALVIDGGSLPFAFSMEEEFSKVIENCETVVVCRATPLQKAMVVRMIKRRTKCFTLSIGDGANDVSMLQEAHIGVGLFGKEGSQAARSSDYAIHRFRHLHRLVCIHGRYNMIRIALLYLVSYYKNIAVFLAAVYFSFYNGFSALTIFDGWILTAYNLVLTSLPPFLISIWEKDVREDVIIKYPQVHREIVTSTNLSLTYKRFLSWWFLALWHSLLIYFIPFFFYSLQQTLSADGKTMGLPEYGMVTFIGGYFVVLAQIAIITKHWNWIIHLGFWGSIVLFFAMFLAISNLKTYSDMWHVSYRIFTSTNAFLVCFVVLAISMAPSLCWEYAVENWYPRYSQLFSKYEKRRQQLNKIYATDKSSTDKP